MSNKLKELLLKNNIISENNLSKIKKYEDEYKCCTKQAITDLKLCKEEEILDAIVLNTNIEYISLKNIKVKNEIINYFSKEVAYKYRAIPFEEKEGSLSVALDDPMNISILDDLKFITHKSIKPYVSSIHNINLALKVYYNKQVVERAIKDLKLHSIFPIENKKIFEDETQESIPIINLINSLIAQAIIKNASDIHIEPFENTILVRYRIDGLLYEYIKLPKEIYSQVVTRIKVMGNMDISQKLLPCDGKFSLKINENYFDFRVSTLPTCFGEKIVIRVLYKSEKINSLEGLGFNTEKDKDFWNLLNKQGGLFLVTGATGSGKTTTLYSILNSINNKNKNIVTIEDPVEYTMPGINQVNVNNKSGLTFIEGLKYTLRQDPDIIMVGEIRDEETAHIAVRAAITGHLVFSTLHTNDAPSAITRLEDMGIPKYLIKDSLTGIISQKLIRKVCEYCKKPHREHKGEGCNICDYTGYKGRTVTYELYYRNSKGSTFKHKTMEDHCLSLVQNGITSMEEYLKVCNERKIYR